MTIAFVLINSDLGKDVEIIGKIKDILKSEKDISYEIQGVYGVYDIVVKVPPLSTPNSIRLAFFPLKTSL